MKLRDSKLAKFKMFTSNFFLEDKTVSPLLEDMKSLIDHKRGLVTSLTFKYAAEALQYSREAAQNSQDGLKLSQGIDNKLDSMNERMLKQQGGESGRGTEEGYCQSYRFRRRES